MATRVETDSLGSIEVPAEMYYGAVTARALQYFAIGSERMPQEIIRSFGILKKAAALTNVDLHVLTPEQGRLIVEAADQVISGQLRAHFPLSVWQSGSGTQTNMNVNEVIANRANELAGHSLGSRQPVHPNDHVNRSQSTNDAFPTALHIAAVSQINGRLLPNIHLLRDAITEKAQRFAAIIKIGRTHLQDATPLTFGQEMSGWATQLSTASAMIDASLGGLQAIALGGTAVGTGLNAPVGYADQVASQISKLTGYRFVSAANKFAALAGQDAEVACSSALKQLAVACLKLANDVRNLASGPRCGLGELLIPANEPGSSIMPGKVNPTQCEALAMVCCQVLANDALIGFAASQGHLELNTYKPVIANSLLQSINLLADACGSFTHHCIAGIEPNRPVIERHLRNSLMLVTALVPHLGYDRSAQLAHYALQHDLSLRSAAIDLDMLSGTEFDRLVDPKQMLGPESTPGTA